MSPEECPLFKFPAGLVSGVFPFLGAHLEAQVGGAVGHGHLLPLRGDSGEPLFVALDGARGERDNNSFREVKLQSRDLPELGKGAHQVREALEDISDYNRRIIGKGSNNLRVFDRNLDVSQKRIDGQREDGT